MSSRDLKRSVDCVDGTAVTPDSLAAQDASSEPPPATWLSDSEDDGPDVAAELDDQRAPLDVLTFRIEGFSKQKSVKIYSEPKTLGEFKWRIMLFPRGNKTTEFVSVYIEVCDLKDLKPGWVLNTRFSVEVANSKDAESTLRHEASHVFGPRDVDWGWQNFVRITDLHDKANGFLGRDDVLTVTASVQRLPDPPPLGSVWSTYDNSRAETGHVGLRNQGATCYMNSLLEALYHTSAFTRAVFQIPTELEEPTKSIPLALQRVFFGLKYSPRAVSTRELTRSFGWDSADSFTQHDVQELNRVLCDNIESKMKGTPAEGTVQRLFCGRVKSYIKCLDVAFESSREEVFYDLALNVKECKDIYASFDKYVESQLLEGDNKYHAEGHGLQRARMGTAFLEFPQVLHLQLKRWEFDVRQEAMIKVNDRFEFPLVLELDRFLDESAQRVPCTYNLTAVLIHSGDVHGGHYYAFVRPRPKGAWYRFDDERVTKVRLNEIFEESYGGDKEIAYQDAFGRKITAFSKRYTNAYMLVYVRLQDIPNVLFNIKSKSIPLHLHKRFANDAVVTETKERERIEASQLTTFLVITEDMFRLHRNKSDLVDISAVAIPICLKRTTKMREVLPLIAEKLGVHPLRVRLWSWVLRINGTNRPESLCSLESTVERQSRVFAEVSERDIPASLDPEKDAAAIASQLFPQPTADEVMIMIKEFIPLENTLQYVGKAFFRKDTMCSAVIEVSRSLARIPYSARVCVFEEIRPGMTEPLLPNKTVHESELGTGDILIVQQLAEVPAEKKEGRFLSCAEFLTHLQNLCVIRFRKYESPKEDFTRLPLSLKSSYDEVVTKLAAAIGPDTNPTFLRLWMNSCYLDGPSYDFVKRTSETTLGDIVRISGSRDRAINDILYFDVLPIPLAEFESKTTIKLFWRSIDLARREEHSIIVSRSGSVRDVLERVAEFHPQQPGGSGKLRLLELFNHRLYREILPDTLVSLLQKHANTSMCYVVEESRQEDEELMATTKYTRISMAHYSLDAVGSAEPFGEPFFLVVSRGANIAEVKALVQKRLNVPEEEFATWTFANLTHAHPVPLLDKDIAVDHVHVSSTGWVTDHLGMGHADPEAKQRKEGSTNQSSRTGLLSMRHAERSIKITG